MGNVPICRHCGHWMVEGKAICAVCGRNQNPCLNFLSKTMAVLGIIVMASTAIIMYLSVRQNEKAISQTRQSIDQTERGLDITSKQLLASINPSLDLSLSMDGKMTLTIENTGVPDVADLKLYQILYRFDTNNVLQDRKIPGGPHYTCPGLKAGDSVSIPRESYFDIDLVNSLQPSPTNHLMSRVLGITIVYRSTVDKKRFIHLEPSFPIVRKDGVGIGLLYQTDQTAWHSRGAQLDERLKQIESKERMMFRIE